jgi:hypothetical protein
MRSALDENPNYADRSGNSLVQSSLPDGIFKLHESFGAHGVRDPNDDIVYSP